jgi:hypothetical protein
MQLIIWIVVGTVVAPLIGQAKGRVGAGAFWGFLLGPIGWLITALGLNKKPKCALCGGEIIEGAIKPKNFGSDLKNVITRRCT